MLCYKGVCFLTRYLSVLLLLPSSLCRVSLRSQTNRRPRLLPPLLPHQKDFSSEDHCVCPVRPALVPSTGNLFCETTESTHLLFPKPFTYFCLRAAPSISVQSGLALPDPHLASASTGFLCRADAARASRRHRSRRRTSAPGRSRPARTSAPRSRSPRSGREPAGASFQRARAGARGARSPSGVAPEVAGAPGDDDARIRTPLPPLSGRPTCAWGPGPRRWRRLKFER